MLLRSWYATYLLHPAISFFGEYASFAMLVGFTQILHFSTFWCHCILLLIVDFNPELCKPFHQWKIQPDKNNPLKRGKFLHCLKVVLFNQFFVNIPVACLLYKAMQMNGNGVNIAAETFPSFSTMLAQFVFFIVIEEIGFYYSHRLMHNPTLYQMFHKKHHEWIAPIGMAAIYAHPVEHILCNLTPLVLGPYFLNAHIFTYWLWLTMAVATTINSHCGYHFPFAPSPENHDFHHLAFNVNYGVLGVLDRLHGTDQLYAGTVQHQRNQVFFNPWSDIRKMTKIIKENYE